MWERLLTMVQAQGVQLGVAFSDGTNIRAHHKAAGAEKRATEPDILRVRHLVDLVVALSALPTSRRRWGFSPMERKPA